jgi:hypothetical protein
MELRKKINILHAHKIEKNEKTNPYYGPLLRNEYGKCPGTF